MSDTGMSDTGMSDTGMTAQAESLLYSALPDRDPVAEQAADLVGLITSSPSLRRVDELSAAAGWSVRSLQRLFADYVGVSPKWVMRRARLHEAAERADSGEVVDWAALAFDLGYADQAHLTREFTATIGEPPTRYAAPPPAWPLRRVSCPASLAGSAALGGFGVRGASAALGGFGGRAGAQVQRPWAASAAGTVRKFSGGRPRAARRASRTVAPDFGGLGADLLRREWQHDDAVFTHPPLPLERPRVILRRQMPFS